MSQPIRVQRKRVKGYRHPENTKFVGRPTKWGNPYTVAWEGVKKEMWMPHWRATREQCLNSYKEWLELHLKFAFNVPILFVLLNANCKLPML